MKTTAILNYSDYYASENQYFDLRFSGHNALQYNYGWGKIEFYKYNKIKPLIEEKEELIKTYKRQLDVKRKDKKQIKDNIRCLEIKNEVLKEDLFYASFTLVIKAHRFLENLGFRQVEHIDDKSNHTEIWEKES